MRRRGRNRIHRRKRNKPLTVRHGGRSHTWKALVKRHGVMGAKRIWHKGQKRHGYGKAGYVYRRRPRAHNTRRRRRGRACRMIRYGKRRYGWRGLVKRFGVRKAKSIWRKHRKIARNSRKGRVRRRRRRNFQRR